jgi:iron complex transport system substrate-binding protein
LLGLSLAVTALVAGCGGGGAKQGATPSAGTSGGFPMTVTAANGKVTIPARPKRIISLSPANTEMLYAVGAGSQVSAVDDQSNYPASAPRTKLSGFKPNVEAITAKSPDLVVLSDDMNGIVKALTKVKIPVIESPAATKLSDSYTEMQTLGTATGHTDQARKAVATMKKGIADAVAGVKKPAKPLTYYHELDPSFHSATSKTFIGQVYGLFGLRDIADKAKEQAGGYPKLSAEYVAEADPNLIFLADTKCCGQSAATVGKRPGFEKLSAVRDGNVVALDDDIASRWGPRVVNLVQQVGEAVTKAEKAQ